MQIDMLLAVFNGENFQKKFTKWGKKRDAQNKIHTFVK